MKDPIILQLTNARRYVLLIYPWQLGEVRIIFQIAQFAEALLQLAAQAIRRRHRLAHAIALDLGDELANARIFLRAMDEQEDGEAEHARRQQGTAGHSPGQLPARLTGARAERACGGKRFP